LKLKKAWGSVIGARWFHMIRGSLQCDYGITNNEVPKSIGHTHVLPPEKRDDAGAFEVFESLLYRAIDRLNKHRIGAKRITIYLSWRNMATKKRGTFKVNSPLAIPTRDYKYWTCIALDLWKKLPDLQINDIPLLVGLRFTRTLDNNDINLQLFDLSWDSNYIYKETYKLPDRISFGDPGRMFDE